jgi:site-specific recombinase XerD
LVSYKKNWLAIRTNWLAIIKNFSYKKKLASYKENWLTVRKNWLAIRKNCITHHSDYLFISKKGTPISRQQIYLLMKRYGAMADLNIAVRPHMLRHSCGYALADTGIDSRLIQDYLYHSHLSLKMFYKPINMKRVAIEMHPSTFLRLDVKSHYFVQRYPTLRFA